jgi:hypothetical protein
MLTRILIGLGCICLGAYFIWDEYKEPESKRIELFRSMPNKKLLYAQYIMLIIMGALVLLGYGHW